MKRFIAVMVLIFGMIPFLFAQTIPVPISTLRSWQDRLNQATVLLDKDDAKIADLIAALNQTNEAIMNLENLLAIAQNSADKSSQIIDQEKALLAQEQDLSKKLTAKVDEQNKAINAVSKDIKELELENTLLKVGLIGAAVVTAAAIVYAIAK